MALFNWFFKKSDSSKAAAPGTAQQAKAGLLTSPASTVVPPNSSRPVADPTNRIEERKARRHARREQLYAAIRQAMTRVGVLSSSFKFKVLSLDQRGDQFLVMIDIHPSLGLQEEKLAESEMLIAQAAKNQFDILVTAVYWRVDMKAEPAAVKPSEFDTTHASPLETPAPVAVMAPVPLPVTSFKKPTSSRYEPIQDDEVSAFKRALAASTAAPAMVAALPTASPAADNASKGRSGLRSYTLITGFEDTEMPESAAVPALSATQYGELN